jgi:hypothetical protein
MKEFGNEEGFRKVEAIGRRLNDGYYYEFGAARAAIRILTVIRIPMEFRNALVTYDSGTNGDTIGEQAKRSN